MQLSNQDDSANQAHTPHTPALTHIHPHTETADRLLKGCAVCRVWQLKLQLALFSLHNGHCSPLPASVPVLTTSHQLQLQLHLPRSLHTPAYAETFG